MKSRPLKVGEYRKVKTWEQLLATEGASVECAGIRFPELIFLSGMASMCGAVVYIEYTSGDSCLITGCLYTYSSDFFTNDYYDKNGKEIIQDEGEDQKSLRRMLLNNNSIQKAMNVLSEYGFNPEIEPPQERTKTITLEVTGENIESPNLTYHWVDDINPLDQLEHEANQTLTKIAKLREIEAKQAEMDKLGLEIEEMIEEYLR